MKKEKNKDLPIATEVLKDYKKNNKNLFTIIVVLLIIIVIETTYLILLLDSMNNSIGIMTEEVHECS